MLGCQNLGCQNTQNLTLTLTLTLTLIGGKYHPCAELPGVYTESDDECESLIVTLEDPGFDLELDLVYVVFRAHDTIVRQTCVRNVSPGAS